MKHLNAYGLLAIAICQLSASLTSCTEPTQQLRNGDLLFVGIPADYSLSDSTMGSAITAATGNGDINYIHAAIIEVDGTENYIIDATMRRGVARYPLDTFLLDFRLHGGALPKLVVKRIANAQLATQGVERAKKFIGQPYDVYFLPNNGAMYCTELVYESYRNADGSPIFNAAPMNFKNADGEYPIYWQQLFQRIGQPIPQDTLGTNPQAMQGEAILIDCGELKVEK